MITSNIIKSNTIFDESGSLPIMKIIDLLETCFNSLKRHKWRTGSYAGIAIGIGGISSMTIFTDSIGMLTKKEIELFGIKNISIYATKKEDSLLRNNICLD